MEIDKYMKKIEKDVKEALQPFVGKKIEPVTYKSLQRELLFATGHFDVPAAPNWWALDMAVHHSGDKALKVDIKNNSVSIDYYVKGSSYDVGRRSIDCCTLKFEA